MCTCDKWLASGRAAACSRGWESNTACERITDESIDNRLHSSYIFLLPFRPPAPALWNTHSLPVVLLTLDCVRTTLSDTRRLATVTYSDVQCESTPPPRFFLTFSPKTVGNVLVQILRAYYTFLSTLDCKFLFNHLQL